MPQYSVRRSARSGKSSTGLVIGLGAVVLLLAGAGVMWSGLLGGKPSSDKPIDAKPVDAKPTGKPVEVQSDAAKPPSELEKLLATLDPPKQPGTVTNAGELPAPMEVRASITWNTFSKPQHSTMWLKIQLLGPLSQRVFRCGMVQLDAIETEPPVALKRRRGQNLDAERMERVERIEPSLPPELKIWFERTDPVPMTLKKVAGRFQIEVAGDPKLYEVGFLFENLPVTEAPALEPGQMVATCKPADNSGELPKGLSLEALVRWSSPVGAKRPLLALGVDVTGTLASRIVSLGNFKVDATTAGGDKLEVQPISGYEGDLTQVMLRASTSTLRSGGLVGGLQADIYFVPPDPAPAQIDSIAGTFELVTAGRRKAVRIEGVKLGEEIENADLKEAGVVLKLTGEQDSPDVELVQGKSTAIDRILLLGAGGKVLSDGKVSLDDAKTRWFIHFPEEVPPIHGLEITLNLDVETLEVPFKFSDIPVPPASQE